MSFYAKVEEALKTRNWRYLKHLEFYYGSEVKVYDIKQDEYSRVYGRSSGALNENYFDLKCIVVNNDVIPLGPNTAGSFTTGALYTTSDDEVNIGQVIELVSGDNRARRFTVTSKKSFGVTTNVLHYYEIQSIGD